jgi:hypothetical protein
LAGNCVSLEFDSQSASWRVLRHDGDVRLRGSVYKPQNLYISNTIGMGKRTEEIDVRYVHWFVMANVCAMAVGGSEQVIRLGFHDALWD